jgi:hypothetical protein
MNLDEAQRKIVAAWIAEGMKLSDIQSRLAADLGLKLTYMEVRLLVDDLKLVPKDPEPKVGVAALGNAPAGRPGKTDPRAPASPAPPAEAEPEVPGGVSVSVDKLARPGAVVSGKVSFSDGNRAEWYLDQAGRLGLSPEVKGYRPSPEDVQEFQMALENELARMGFA